MWDKERRESSDHLKDNIAKSPPICCKADVYSLLEYLRRQILRCSSNWISLIQKIDSTAETKIDESNEAFFIDEDVFWFEAVW